MACLVAGFIPAGFLPAPSQAQFLSQIEVGKSLQYKQYYTPAYRKHFLPRPKINLSLQTPFHAGYLHASLSFVENEARTSNVREYKNLKAILFWLGKLPFSERTALFTGIGTGAEIYFLDPDLSNSTEKEILFAGRIELQHARNRLVFFADAEVAKVYVYHRMVYWNTGLGLRYRFHLNE